MPAFSANPTGLPNAVIDLNRYFYPSLLTCVALTVLSHAVLCGAPP
jgi:hypothetical protein